MWTGVGQSWLTPYLASEPEWASVVTGVESAPAVRRGVGFDAPAVRAGTGGGGENRGAPVRAQRGGLALAPVGGRATVAAQHAGGRFPGGVRLAGAWSAVATASGPTVSGRRASAAGPVGVV